MTKTEESSGFPVHDRARHPRGVRVARIAIQAAFLMALGAGCVFAQAAAEYGNITSGMAGSISGIGNTIKNNFSFPTTQLSSAGSTNTFTPPPAKTAPTGAYIFESLSNQDGPETNRKAFEEKAGKTPAKLMLRSNPDGAYVHLDGKLVGKTPLLLVVAPGAYTLEMDGARLAPHEQKVDLLPKETREFAITLKPDYPTEVQIHLQPPASARHM